jgi:hypothetical protein
MAAFTRRFACLSLAVCSWQLVAGSLPAQRPDSATTDTVVPGVLHRHLLEAAGPWSINVLQVDLRQPGISIRAAHADNKLHGRESVSAIARRNTSDTATVVAAINADFFNLRTGEDESNQVIEGEIWKGVSVADTLADSHHQPHAQFGVAGDGRPFIAPFVFQGIVLRPGGEQFSLDGINYRRDARSVVLYTEHFGTMSPPDSSDALVELRLGYISSQRDTSIYQVQGLPVEAGTSSLADGPVLSLPRDGEENAALPRPGELIRIQTNLRPAPLGLRTVVGGWPRLVVHGVSVAASADRLEGTAPPFSAQRHPRTGVGMSRDSTTLYLVTVDGRQAPSAGMSLSEFAALMLRLGVYEGLNLDGGGSTAMVVNDHVVNVPSDKNGSGNFAERAVGNALLVVQSHHD